MTPRALTTCQSQKELLKKWVLGAAGPPSAPASVAAGDASSLLDGASSDELLCSACVSKHRPQRWDRTCKSLESTVMPNCTGCPS